MLLWFRSQWQHNRSIILFAKGLLGFYTCEQRLFLSSHYHLTNLQVYLQKLQINWQTDADRWLASSTEREKVLLHRIVSVQESDKSQMGANGLKRSQVMLFQHTDWNRKNFTGNCELWSKERVSSNFHKQGTASLHPLVLRKFKLQGDLTIKTCR